MGFFSAVIDIGSNSVRLVIYFIEGRSVWSVFNEKVLAGLGRDLKDTNRLSVTGKNETLTVLRRFKAVLESYDLKELHVVATAACRDASDGAAFIAQIYLETGFQVRVLSGEEEAYYSAQGVRCGHQDAQGVMGDLGGSSLELIDLNAKPFEAGITLPLGPFALGAPKTLLLQQTYRHIMAQLEPYKERFKHERFHAVGGAWRNLAIIWLKKRLYPLQIVHQFEMEANEALDTAKFIASLSPASLERVPGIPKRRLENIAYAALVMQCLIETFGFKTIEFSAYGLREGLLYDDMSAQLQLEDPLIAGCKAWGTRLGIHDRIGLALADWAVRFFETDYDNRFAMPPVRIITAAAKLSDLGARLHPDHRNDLASDLVLRAPIPGQNHFERVFLAACLYTRYCGDPYPKDSELVSRILGEDGLRKATQLGLLLRLGCDLSAKSHKLLAHAKIALKDDQICLKADTGWESLLLGEQTKKRAKSLANQMGLGLHIEEN